MEKFCEITQVQFINNNHISNPNQFYDNKHLNHRGFKFFAKNLKSALFNTTTRKSREREKDHPTISITFLETDNLTWTQLDLQSSELHIYGQNFLVRRQLKDLHLCPLLVINLLMPPSQRHQLYHPSKWTLTIQKFQVYQYL